MNDIALRFKQIYTGSRGVATEKFSGGHLKIGGAQRGYFRNFGRFYGFFIAISEIIGGARAPPAPPVTTPLHAVQVH